MPEARLTKRMIKKVMWLKAVHYKQHSCILKAPTYVNSRRAAVLLIKARTRKEKRKENDEGIF